MPHDSASSRRDFTVGLATFACGLGLPSCASVMRAAGEAPAEELNSVYRLGAGDGLRVSVFGEDELTGEYVVGAHGVIAFPLIEKAPAAGLTVDEFTDLLAQELGKYIRQPIVSVEVINYRPFFILGEVQTPGEYAYSARLTVHNAVATAGGFTIRANTRRVFIKHENEVEEKEYLLTSTTPVSPGDTVRIAERIL